jgi:hypothetical protein
MSSYKPWQKKATINIRKGVKSRYATALIGSIQSLAAISMFGKKKRKTFAFVLHCATKAFFETFQNELTLNLIRNEIVSGWRISG